MNNWNRDEAERVLRQITNFPPLGSKLDESLVRTFRAIVENGMRELEIRGMLGFNATWTIGFIRANPSMLVPIVVTSDGEVLFPTEVNFG